MRTASDGVEIPPTVRMIAGIIDHLEHYFIESGCPLNDKQAEVLQDARRALDEQAAQVARVLERAA